MSYLEELEELIDDEESRDAIEAVVKKELEILTEEEKQYLLDHSDYVEHHFFYGLHLRNTYIYKSKILNNYVFLSADELSHIIFDKIIDAIKNST